VAICTAPSGLTGDADCDDVNAACGSGVVCSAEDGGAGRASCCWEDRGGDWLSTSAGKPPLMISARCSSRLQHTNTQLVSQTGSE